MIIDCICQTKSESKIYICDLQEEWYLRERLLERNNKLIVKIMSNVFDVKRKLIVFLCKIILLLFASCSFLRYLWYKDQILNNKITAWISVCGLLIHKRLICNKKIVLNIGITYRYISCRNHWCNPRNRFWDLRRRTVRILVNRFTNNITS